MDSVGIVSSLSIVVFVSIWIAYDLYRHLVQWEWDHVYNLIFIYVDKHM